MKQIWKRNIVAATVLLFVCAAVYLNWKYASNVTDAVSQGDDAKILGQSTLVSGQEELESTSPQETGGTLEEAESVTGDYFATARLTRQQARDSAISLLREASESEVADTAVANEAAQTIQVLASYALTEAQIENLVTAKGYADCVAFMGEDSVSVVVSDSDGLAAEDVAKISEIVLAETDYTADQIKILEAN